jgi:hypothetical protein
MGWGDGVAATFAGTRRLGLWCAGRTRKIEQRLRLQPVGAWVRCCWRRADFADGQAGPTQTGQNIDSKLLIETLLDGPRGKGAGPLWSSICEGTRRCRRPIIFQCKQFYAPISIAPGKDSIAGMWRAMFEGGSKGDICENRASNASRIQNEASTWSMNDALSVAVAAQDNSRRGRIF